MVTIRPEQPKDLAGVRHVNERAFGRPNEADLVDALRAHSKAMLSLVAVQDNKIVGHILFSPMTIESEGKSFSAIGLGPMAVLPEYQRTGIGSALIDQGLEQCREAGHACVVVLGHPEYYPRFGFVPASKYGIKCEYNAPDEAFMVIELRKGALRGRSGTVKYQHEFNEA
ncbi:N-acetyltransferase [candidate division KSB1 bacterium]|nr:N-acetyltransferase [candidate division KSB1 bacterium]